MWQNLEKFVKALTDIGSLIIPFLGALAFLFFVLNVAKFIKSSSNEKEIKESKNMLIWGVIGLFVLMSIWGIITFIRSEFGWKDTLGIPQIQI